MACTAESTSGGKTFLALPAEIEYEYRSAEYEYEHDSIGALDETFPVTRCAVKSCVRRCAIKLGAIEVAQSNPRW